MDTAGTAIERDDVSVYMGLANLHDTFLNASLQFHAMSNSPLERDPDAFHISDRARFERSWTMFLYVLIESWRSQPMTPVREYVKTCADISRLEEVLRVGDENGAIRKMRNVRDYMCHRDRREYWDTGRTDVLLQLDFNSTLHSAFGEVLRTAMVAAEADDSIQ